MSSENDGRFGKENSVPQEKADLKRLVIGLNGLLPPSLQLGRTGSFGLPPSPERTIP